MLTLLMCFKARVTFVEEKRQQFIDDDDDYYFFNVL